MADRKPTQKTRPKKGKPVEIPVPKRKQIEGLLKRAANPELMMNTRRALLLIPIGAALAATLGLVVNAVGASDPVIYAIGGAALALFTALGVLWVLGFVPDPPLHDLEKVRAYETAVIADNDDNPGTPVESHVLLIAAQRWEKVEFVGDQPVVVSAHGTQVGDSAFLKGTDEAVAGSVRIAHLAEPILGSHGAS